MSDEIDFLALTAAAVNAKKSISSDILLIGVTVLTSLDQKDLSDIGVSNDLRDQIISLINLGKRGGIDGIVCSPNDLAYIKKEEMDSLITVCPGIRIKAELGGQKRTSTIHAVSYTHLTLPTIPTV